SKLILAPVASRLGTKRLLIVADGGLQYVPFAALADPSEKTYQPLIASHEIVSLPSASTLAVARLEQAQRPVPKRMLAVLADPVFDKNDERMNLAKPKSEQTEDRAINLFDSRTLDRISEAELETQKEADSKQVSIPRLPFTKAEADQI